MILQNLVDYYEALAKRGEISAQGWCKQKVLFSLNLSHEGELLNVVPLAESEMRGTKTVEVPKVLSVPLSLVKAGSVVKSNFLCENTGYFLGFDNKGKPERALTYFEAAKTLHTSLLEGCDSTAAKAVVQFFQKWDPITAQEHPALLPYLDKFAIANLVFEIDGEYAQADETVREAWNKYYSKDSESTQMCCLVTGKTVPVARIHGKIKGVKNAASSGPNLISFNMQASESFGRKEEQGLNAPVGEYAEFAYVAALNHLLANMENKQYISDTTMVYWAEQADPVPPKVFNMFIAPEESDDFALDGIMKKLAQGTAVDGINMDGNFYILGLAPNNARLSVRFFLRSNFGTILENLRLHYMRLEIVRPSFEKNRYLSAYHLLNETVNPNSTVKKPEAPMSGSLMRSILMGTPYPQSLYQAVLLRIRAEKKVSAGRASIIKAYLIHNQNEKEVSTVALNENSNNRAYVLGRLFAVLEDTQKQALPGITSTIKDRFFTSACATPAIVFPQLLKLSTYHTAKLEYGYARENDKARLMDKLNVDENPIPSHHSLNEQGIFILGYYHQVQARYKKKEDKDNGSD